MVISGEWKLDDDGVYRPVLTVFVAGVDGSQIEELFLIDSGADLTVFRLDLNDRIDLPPANNSRGSTLIGLVGATETIRVSTSLVLKTIEGVSISIKGDFTALTDPTAIDTSILGRDVLSHFDLILSRRRNEVLLIAGNHGYSITSS